MKEFLLVTAVVFGIMVLPVWALLVLSAVQLAVFIAENLPLSDK